MWAPSYTCMINTSWYLLHRHASASSPFSGLAQLGREWCISTGAERVDVSHSQHRLGLITLSDRARHEFRSAQALMLCLHTAHPAIVGLLPLTHNATCYLREVYIHKSHTSFQIMKVWHCTLLTWVTSVYTFSLSHSRSLHIFFES